MSGTTDADQDHRIPGRDRSERLRQQHQQGDEGENQHRPHPGRVRIGARPVDEDRRELAAIEREHRDGIKDEDHGAALAFGHLDAELRIEVRRCPEKEEPPDAVRQEFAQGESPGLPITEALQEGHLLLLRLRLLHQIGLKLLVLLDIGQLGGVDKAALGGRAVHEDPEAHPDEAQHTDDDERQLPAPSLRQIGNAERSDERANRGPGVEDRGREGTVALGEIFGRHLDRRREIARLANGQHATGHEEEIHTDGRDQHRHVARGGDQLGLVGQSHLPLRRDAAEGMQAGAGRPDADRPEEAALRAQPVDHPSGEEHADRVNDGESGRHHAIMRLVPMKLRLDELIPRQREHLAVQVIDRQGQEHHATDGPAIMGHARCRLVRARHTHPLARLMISKE